jgi:Fe-S-cluster containining protein
MDLRSPFSYQCNACGRCCHNQVITLSPYDVIRLAHAANLSTSETIARFTLRRGSLLRFNPDGACIALDGSRCGIHPGRPLACRLYPLGFQRDGSRESFIQLEPAAGSAGIYGTDSTVAAFLEAQGVAPYLNATERSHSLVPLMRNRIATLADFARIEPREFWRRAFNEAMRESGYDPNPLIDALFDADAAVAPIQYASECDLIDAHVRVIEGMVIRTSDPAMIASAVMLLAVSLGYSPAEAIITQ